MLKNHIKIAWRSLKKQPFFTFLNTFGLAIGMAGSLLIALYIYDELQYDTMFTDADRIYRINADVKFGGLMEQLGEVSEPMAAALKRDFPQIEETTRFADNGSLMLRKSNATVNAKELFTTYADSTLFKMFGLKLLVGNPNTALKDPNTLVMTRTAAEKHFGVNNALGQKMVVNNTQTYTVSGVLEDFPKNSFLRNHSVFMNMAGYPNMQVAHWGSHNYFTFIKLVPSANSSELDASLGSLIGKYLIPWVQVYYPGMTEESFTASGNYINYSTMPLKDIHLYSSKKTEMSPNGTIQNIYILSFIAVFLIVLASVNFMNLSTSHSLKRAKEVGVRKTLGSQKKDLVRQFLIESGLVSFISLLLSLGVALLALPYFNDLAGKDISIPFGNPMFWLILIASTLVLGLFSGMYPAFFMSRFIPVKVLKSGGQGDVGGGKIRNALVIFQFAISVFLIVGTLTIFQQLRFIQNKELGFEKSQVLVIDDVRNAGNQVQSFKEEVKQLAQVTNATLSSFLPTPSVRSSSTYFKEGARDQENAINMENWRVDHDYLSTLDLEIVAGRNFDRNISTDSAATIVNESALEVLGVSANEIIGTRISADLGEENPTYTTVIGVVKDFHFESLRQPIEALSLTIGTFSNSLAIKLKTENLSESISSIGRLWDKVAPGQPFDYYFMDESFNNTYQAEQRLGKIFMIFSVLSIVIACLGLLGLAAFNAQKRTKEIGVRKVLGASVSQITYRLTIDFLRLVGIGILIAVPVGWFSMDQWLQDFSYRISISWDVFVLAATLAVGTAVLTVSYQSIKAAIVNPVKSLRTD
ncbi:ABC transporter permease [Flagellimonas flava]|uniref:Putative ABC transport system permease protein n=1 Tax=Flagellimonas flava TaxID=570519 RepID=A0A1M5KXD2_9FLAO|nr:ABC transporter permease [Allomuricauda flava]SHG56823.1 putative ABC transport system permease protein [Allomuricauda flava]